MRSRGKKMLSGFVAVLMVMGGVLGLLAPGAGQAYAASEGSWKNVGSAGFSESQVDFLSMYVSDGIPYVAYRDTVKKYDGSSWETVGSTGFTADDVTNLSLYVSNGTPYVVYSDGGSDFKATVKKYDGSSWETVGIAGFSAGEPGNLSLYVSNGIPYVAYSDEENANIATVMKYDGSSWETVGSAGFSANQASYTSFYVSDGTPYLAFRGDKGTGYKATVMKYNGSSWETVGSAGFSAGQAFSTSLYVYDGIPYVAYEDGGNDSKATVMKYNGNSWETVGEPGFSAGRASSTSLNVSDGTPYVVYQDKEEGYKATVMKYNGSSWETVGNAGFSAGEASVLSLYVSGGTPYVAYMDNGNDYKATVMTFLHTPPSLTADTTNNDTAHAIELTFEEDAAWRGAITSVKDGAAAVTKSAYTVSAGKITFNAGALAVGNHAITIMANGYAVATVSQTVKASTEATMTSTLGTVSTGGTANESITNIPIGTTVTALKAAITPAANATFEIYDADGITAATTLATGMKVIVTAQDGTTKVTYKVTVKEAPPVLPVLSDNALLSSLAADQGALTPAFSSANLNYTLGVANSVSTVKLTLIQADPYQSITVTGATYLSVTGNVYAYEASNLIVGSNPIQIAVTAQDGKTKNLYSLSVDRAAAATPPYIGGGTPAIPSDKVTSTDGKLTLPAGKMGEVSLGDGITISIPADASVRELKLIIDQVLDTQKLLSSKDVLASPIFEISKNFPENFNKPVTMIFAFDSKSLKSNQQASVFYYDEAKKAWVEVGGKINGNHITVEVNHFTKYAVFAVGQEAEVPTPDTKPTITFSDISGHWAEANIKKAIKDGIVSGYPDATFKPEKIVTRAEFAVMLMNALKPQEEGDALPFTDAAKIGAWAQKAVAQAVQAGLIKGDKNGTFRPDAAITRAEMAVILANALGLSTQDKAATGFADDKDIPAWAKASVAYVKKAGIVAGKGNGKFAPQAKATRAEAVTVLLNMLAHKSS